MLADKVYSARAHGTRLCTRDQYRHIPELSDQVRNRKRRDSRGGRPPASMPRPAAAARSSSLPSTLSSSGATWPPATTARRRLPRRRRPTCDHDLAQAPLETRPGCSLGSPGFVETGGAQADEQLVRPPARPGGTHAQPRPDRDAAQCGGQVVLPTPPVPGSRVPSPASVRFKLVRSHLGASRRSGGPARPRVAKVTELVGPYLDLPQDAVVL